MFWGEKSVVVPAWRDSAAAVAFASLETVFALQGELVTRDGESSVIQVKAGGQVFYVKRYHATAGLRSWFGRARIRLEPRNLLWFRQLGLPAAEVVAYGEDFCGSRTLRGYLVTAEQPASRDLAWVAANRPELLQDAGWIESVIRQVAEVARTLHRHRFCHNDLKWRNILVSLEPVEPRICLIDCPVGQRWPLFLLRRRVIKDLACLDKVAKCRLRRTQRLRFFKLYRCCDRLSAGDKDMIRSVLAFFAGRE